MKLKTLLSELSINSTLYHRSNVDYKVGDKISPKSHEWIRKEEFEQALELYREKNFPDIISRADCIYATVIPRTRFSSKGKLYVVKPIGTKVFMTDSQLIDRMGELFRRDRYNRYGDSKEKLDEYHLLALLDHDIAEKYWKGTERADKEDLEVLLEGAIVTEVIEGDIILKRGDKIQIITPFEVNGTVYSCKTEKIAEAIKKYLSEKYLDKSEFKIRSSDFAGRKEFQIEIVKGMIKKGVNLFVGMSRDKMSFNKDVRKDASGKGKYTNMMFYTEFPPKSRKSYGMIAFRPIDQKFDKYIKKL